MNKMKLEYGIYGLLLGAGLGIVLGLSQLYYFKRSIANKYGSEMIVATSVLLSIVGYTRGNKIGEMSYIKNEIGEADSSTNFIKDGKYWVGVTDWIDKRSNIQYRLLTARSNQKYIVSALDNKVILKHEEISASKVTIPKLHEKAKQEIFNKIVLDYYQFKGGNVSSLFSTVKE
jgi:hypothetical protein